MSRVRPTTVALGVILAGFLYLLRLSYWPPGSPNMVVAQDGTRIKRIQVEDREDRILWQISTSAGQLSEDLGVVRYGEVPAGFTQGVPAHGAPRPFAVNEGLSIYVLTERNCLGSGGRARGPDSYLEVVWFSGPLPTQETTSGSIGEALRYRPATGPGTGQKTKDGKDAG